MNSKGGTRSYGLKDWIRRRYNYLAAHYGIDSNHKLINPRPVIVDVSFALNQPLEWRGSYPDIIELYNYNQLPLYTPDPDYIDDSIPTIGINTNANGPFIVDVNDSSSTSCWAEKQGYQCCLNCNVIHEDNIGSWGMENGVWCGISNTCKSNATEAGCFSIKLGHPCCSTCTFYYEDINGKWGIENNEWCGLKDSC